MQHFAFIGLLAVHKGLLEAHKGLLAVHKGLLVVHNHTFCEEF